MTSIPLEDTNMTLGNNTSLVPTFNRYVSSPEASIEPATTMQDFTTSSSTNLGTEALINLGAGVVITLLTFFGQVLVFVVVYHDPRLRTPSNLFIVSLASADMLISLLSMPVWTMYSTLGYWPLSQLLCDLWNTLDYVLCIISIYTILFISVDRYLSLRYPLKYAINRTKTKAKVILVGIWLVTTAIYGTFVLVTQYIFGKVRNTNECNMYYLSYPVVTIPHCVVSMWLPVMGTLNLYVLIFRIASKAGKINSKFEKGSQKEVNSSSTSTENKRNAGNEESQVDIITSSSSGTPGKGSGQRVKVKDSQEERERKAAQTIALLLIIYAICWLPMSVVFTIMAYDPEAVGLRWLVFVYWLGYLNSTLNPICYATGNPFFRETMTRLFCGENPKSKNESRATESLSIESRK